MKLKNIIYNLSKLPSYSPPQTINFKDSDRRQEKCNALNDVDEIWKCYLGRDEHIGLYYVRVLARTT